MQNAGDVQKKLNELYTQAWALTAFGIAVERGLLGAVISPATAEEAASRSGLSADLTRGILDVLSAIGLVAREEHGRYRAMSGLAAALGGTGAGTLRADLRSTLGQHQGLLASARMDGAAIEGWQALDPVVVSAQGDLSRDVTERMARLFFPKVGDLDARLQQPGATALDVGAGAGGGCVGLARAYPNLRVVGLEPSPVACEVARKVIEESDLGHRIEVRQIGIERLEDVDLYDYAYVAQMFIPDEPLVRGLPAVLRALRPGGWFVTAAVTLPGEDLVAAVSRLRAVTWGGGRRSSDDVVRLLREAGFSEVQLLPPWGTLTPVLARRAP